MSRNSLLGDLPIRIDAIRSATDSKTCTTEAVMYRQVHNAVQQRKPIWNACPEIEFYHKQWYFVFLSLRRLHICGYPSSRFLSQQAASGIRPTMRRNGAVGFDFFVKLCSLYVRLFYARYIGWHGWLVWSLDWSVLIKLKYLHLLPIIPQSYRKAARTEQRDQNEKDRTVDWIGH